MRCASEDTDLSDEYEQKWRWSQNFPQIEFDLVELY